VSRLGDKRIRAASARRFVVSLAGWIRAAATPLRQQVSFSDDLGGISHLQGGGSRVRWLVDQ
jgi:hypothetical protein